MVKCNKSSEEICKHIVNVVSADMYLKKNALQKSVSVASTFTCVQAQKNS
ncbi:protein of unknown function [Candidatus Nitrosotalea okcheonensis]|uniref:Uncharacterized protein n=1 Tax=Candidatus Nitrosotalea okcheonensis TaxID=1903276 RepID=A0A2H1FDF1_9ARCH|nr:protein of unknown function [Candidatus Nitrosotalea okcheonensis]